jgi:hypothetical protein
MPTFAEPLDSSPADAFLRLLAHRAVNPPLSSWLAEEERLRLLLLRAAARDSRRSQPCPGLIPVLDTRGANLGRRRRSFSNPSAFWEPLTQSRGESAYFVVTRRR